jgi:uncharacterized membrane protein
VSGARSGFSFVQDRIAALRRAVVAEVEDLNRLIFHVLRGGVVVSVSFLLFGFVLSVFTAHPLPDFATPPRLLGLQLFEFDPDGYLTLGVLLLIFTPIVRVFLSLLAFAEERDQTYVALTGVVLVNLLASVLLVG